MVVLRSPSSTRRTGRGTAGAHAADAPRREEPRRFAPGSTAAKLRLLIVGLIAASIAWGAVAAWTVSQHASAADDVVSSSEPLSLDAQRMYQSLSDADVTATAAFLSGPVESFEARQRYAADIARAAAELAYLKNAAGSAGQQIRASLDAVSIGLPSYTADVAEARTYYSLGSQLTGGSFMQVASEEMHLTLLPAAGRIYRQENAALEAASARATGLPWVAGVLVLAVIIVIVLYATQRWLWRRTHRLVNYGMLAASAALAVSSLWMVTAFAFARADLQRGVGNGSTPAETLARAGIAVQQARGDEMLNLISRSGATSFEQNFSALRSEIGPGPGTLLTDAAASSSGGSAARPVAAAARDASAWYAVDEQVFRLDLAAHYAADTQIVIGTGPTSSAAGFARLEADLGRAMAADQVIFRSSATAGADTFSGLEAGVIADAVIMLAGCTWGLSQRLAEYR
jgi:ABC-type multidrug transport system fused ATPase/permease subunit